jgi:predicted nuclease with TOPRIM domain
MEAMRVTWTDDRLDELGGKVEALDRRLGRLEVKIEALEDRVGRLEVKIEALDNRVGKLEVRVEALEQRIGRLEHAVDALRVEMVAGFGELRGEIKTMTTAMIIGFVTMFAAIIGVMTAIFTQS